MPLYEYQCEQCAERFERIQKFSDPLVTECPRCGKGPVRKLISSPAIQFKGSGWYITDYAKSGAQDKGNAAKAEGGTQGDAQKSSGDGPASSEKRSGDGPSSDQSSSSAPSSGKAAESKPAAPAASGTKS